MEIALTTAANADYCEPRSSQRGLFYVRAEHLATWQPRILRKAGGYSALIMLTYMSGLARCFVK